MVTFKEYIEKEYPNFRERENVENLSIAGKNLEGEMNFAGLGFNNLKTIDCWGNRFAGINFDALNANKLTFFDIGENGIKFDINLSYFSRFPNLNTLVLHSNPGAVGNLESLKDLKKLEYFKIHNTNIEGNIESLPTSIKGFQYYGSKVNDPISLTYSYGTDVVGNKLLDYKKQRVISKLNLTGKKKIKIENATRDNFEEILAEILIEENGEDKLVEIQLPLKDIPSKYWDKVEVDNNWDREYQVDASIELPIMVNQVGGNPWDKKFKSQEILDKFKIFTNPNDKFFGRTGHAEETHNPPWTIKDIDADTYYFIHTPSKISNLIKGGGKVLKESNRLQSKESFEFLQSIIGYYQTK